MKFKSIKNSALKISTILSLTLGLGLGLNNCASAKPHKNLFYGELYGVGGGYSINYERMLSSNMSIRIGGGSLFMDIEEQFHGSIPIIMDIQDNGDPIFRSIQPSPPLRFKWSRYTVPVMANYLVGKANHQFEIGAGFSFAHSKFSAIQKHGLDYKDCSVTELSPILTTGYRYSQNSGLNFRLGVSGQFIHTVFAPSPYLSVGIQF